jgi:CCR4-NOT transcription complex subunit 1
LNYTVVDVFSNLLVLMFRHMNSGGTQEQIEAQRLSILNKILGVIVRCMMSDAESKKASAQSQWDQRPWFRLVLNLLIDVNKPDPALEPIKLGVLSVFGATFHVCQPLVLPGECLASLR